MHKALLIKTLRDLRGQVLCWGLGIGLILLLTVLAYPSIGSSYNDMINQMPENFRAFMGIDFSLNTLEGYLNAEFFSYAPIALAVFAILAGTACIVGEENQGTLDILLAQPISRLHLVITKMVGLVLANGMVVAILFTMFWIPVAFLELEVQVGRIMVAFVLLWPFLTCVTFLSVLASLIMSSRLLGGTAIAVFLVASYILNSLANLVSKLEPFRPIYLTSYYQGSNALGDEVSWLYIAGLAGISLIAFSLCMLIFIRRDIAVQKSIRLPKLLRPRAETSAS